MKQSLLSSTSLATATVAPTISLGTGRPSTVAAITVRPSSTLVAASMAGMLAAATPADAAVIYSVNGVNAGTATYNSSSVATSFTASTLYVGFGSGSFTTNPLSIVGGMLIGSASAGQTFTTTVVLANTNASKGNITVATAATTFTGGFTSTTNNYGTINNGGGQTLTNTYTYVPGSTGTVRGVAGSMKQDLLGREAGGGQGVPTDTTTIVLISNWVAPVQSTTMTGTAAVSGSTATSVTNQTATSADGFVYVLPGKSAATTVTVNNIGDGNMAANATTIATGFGNLKGTTTSSTSATGTGGFTVSATTSASFSLNDANANNIPSITTTVTTSTAYTYTYTGNTTRGSSAAATLTVNFSNGNSDNTNASQTAKYTVVGRTVAPVQSVATTATTLYALPTQAGPTQSLTITNTGDGSFVGASLTGTVSAATNTASVSVANTGSFALADMANGAAASSTTRTVTLSFTGGASRSAAATVATVTSNFTNGNSNNTNTGQTVTTVFTGQTVAPVQSTTATNTTIYALPGQAGTTQGTFNLKNIGDGSLAGATLNGTLNTTPGIAFSSSLGNSAAIALNDGVTGPAATTLTQTLTYTGEATRGSSTVATVTAALTNGHSNSTNAAQSVTQTFTGVTVAPVASTTTTGTGTTQYVLVGSGATVAGSLSVKNIGDGTLAGANLSGTLANTTATGFATSTAAGTISLGDSNNAGPNGTSLSQTLTYTAETTRSGAVRTASSVVTFSNGNASGNNTAAASAAVTVSAQSVAPLASVTASVNGPEIRVGTTTTVALEVKNVGDGNLAGPDSVSLKTNLHGVVGTGSGSFSGSGGTVNLTDSSSSTYLFTYAPTARTNGLTETAIVTTTLQNGADNTNASGPVTTTLSAKAVGPVYESKFTTNGATTTTTLAANGPGTGTAPNVTVYGGTILFGDAVGGLSLQNLLISNISNDNASKNLTDLNLTSVSIVGSSEYQFSLSGFASGGTGGGTVGYVDSTTTSFTLNNTKNGDYQGNIAIQFVSKAGNGLGQLRITTDENTAENGAGTIYIYDLRWTVPEPGTIMVFGAGLLGLAISRRNRRGKAEAVRLTAGGDDAPRA